jgi:hypothetical protein
LNFSFVPKQKHDGTQQVVSQFPMHRVQVAKYQKKNRAIYFEKRALKKHPVGIKKNRASKKKLESLVSMGNKTVHFCRICIVLEVAPLARKVFAGHWTWKSRIRMFC